MQPRVPASHSPEPSTSASPANTGLPLEAFVLSHSESNTVHLGPVSVRPESRGCICGLSCSAPGCHHPPSPSVSASSSSVLMFSALVLGVCLFGFFLFRTPELPGLVCLRWHLSADCPGWRRGMVTVPAALASMPHNSIFLHVSLALPELLSLHQSPG